MTGYLDRRHLSITGADSRDFLQNLITQNVPEAGLAYGALLTPQGKLITDFFIRPAEGGYALDLPAATFASVMQRLTMYKLRADVTLNELSIALFCGQSDRPADAYMDPRDPALGWRLYDGDRAGDEGQDWDALRIAHGVPAFGHELDGESYILEMAFDRLGGVSFTKGCYVGQEVTARMHHKTTLQKGLAQITGDAPLPNGAQLMANGKEIGQITTAHGSQALAYVNFKRLGDHAVTAVADTGAIEIHTITSLL